MTSIVQPSYQSGFYSPKRGGVPAHPELWRGCVGAWCPSLGITGARLFDQNVYANHGTLTNMSPADDWVVSGSGLALDFDGTNDYVNCGTNSGKIGIQFTISMWVKPASLGNYRGVVCRSGSWNEATTQWAIEFGNGISTAAIGMCMGGSKQNIAVTLVAGQWQFVSVTSTGTEVICRHDDVIVTNTKTFGAPSYSTESLTIGSFTTTQGLYAGQIDDVRVYDRALGVGETKKLRTRRGIAYETEYVPIGKAGAAPPATRNDNLLLLGVS